MSRSFRKHSVFSFLRARSSRWFKKLSNGRLRVARRSNLAAIEDFDELVLPRIEEVSELWTSPKEGTGWITEDGLKEISAFINKPVSQIMRK